MKSGISGNLQCCDVRFLLCAISPAVVVPTLLDLKERGYGEDKGIPTLVLAACSLDDITAISMFSLFLNMIFSTGQYTTHLSNSILSLARIIFGLS